MEVRDAKALQAEMDGLEKQFAVSVLLGLKGRYIQDGLGLLGMHSGRDAASGHTWRLVAM